MTATTPPMPDAVAAFLAQACGDYDDAFDWYTTAKTDGATLTVTVTAYDADEVQHDIATFRVHVEDATRHAAADRAAREAAPA